MIVIGTTRKPSSRLRSFVKELNRVIPKSIRLTRGKQGFDEFCEAVEDLGATRILLVGAFHGNPGRLGFLHYTGNDWEFQQPTIIIKAVRLLRESSNTTPKSIKTLFVIPNTPQDQSKAELLSNALDASLATREELPNSMRNSALLRISWHQQKMIDFLSLDEKHPFGPSLLLKHFLYRPMGDRKRW